MPFYMPGDQYSTEVPSAGSQNFYLEPIQGNSLDWIGRSLTNRGAQEGFETSQSGKATSAKGMEALEPVLKYLKGLLGGDQQAMLQAIQPESDIVSDQFAQIRRLLTTGSTRGGGRDTALAGLPMQQQGQMSTLLNKVRPQAASQLSSLGQGLAGLGLSEQGLGSSITNSTLSALLARRGQNVQETANTQSFLGSTGFLQQLVKLLI